VAHGKVLPPEVVEQIVAKTDGVPLFVEELTKMVLESGLFQERDERYTLTGSLHPLAIPATLHDSLMARLDRLAAVKALAQLGATLGREFSYALLRAVAPWEEGIVRQGLHQLVAAEFLYQRGLPPQATYTFKHALIQGVAYQSLLRSTRQQYHQRIAQALEAQFPEIVETQPELVAQHYTAAGYTEQAILYWLRAGQQASDRSAYLEAVSHVTTGIELLTTLPETPEHTRQALTLYIVLGAALQVTKGVAAPEVEHAYTQARALCQQVGKSLELGSVLFGLWRFYHVRLQLHTARELGETLLRLAQHAHDPALTVIVHDALGVTWFLLSAFPAARQHLEEGIALYTPDQHRALVFRTGHDPGVFCRAYAALTLWVLGGTRIKPWPASTRPWRWHTSCRIPIVWRGRGVGRRPSSFSFAGTCRPCTNRQRPPSSSRPSRAFHSGRPWERACVGGRWPCRARARRGWPRSARGSPPGEPLGQRCTSHIFAPCWRKSMTTWATRKTVSRRWPRPTPWWSSMTNAGGKRRSIASAASCSCGSRGHRRRGQKPGCSAPWTSPVARMPNRWSCGPP
jgi:tetratricopeptide (TPR) repeat protein